MVNCWQDLSYGDEVRFNFWELQVVMRGFEKGSKPTKKGLKFVKETEFVQGFEHFYHT
jgi:hypothetical protein